MALRKSRSKRTISKEELVPGSQMSTQEKGDNLEEKDGEKTEAGGEEADETKEDSNEKKDKDDVPVPVYPSHKKGFFFFRKLAGDVTFDFSLPRLALTAFVSLQFRIAFQFP